MRWLKRMETLSGRFQKPETGNEIWQYGGEDLRELFSVWLLDSIVRTMSVYHRKKQLPIASEIANLREQAAEVERRLRTNGWFFGRDSSIISDYKTMIVRSGSYGQLFHEQFRPEMSTAEALELMKRNVALWDWRWFWKHHQR